MNEQVLTADIILEAAEEVLRRFGPAKATVVDVARALGVSHGAVYRHFASKAALRDAVVERWLHRVSAPLAGLAAAEGPAEAKLRAWFEGLRAAKTAKVVGDPELFATYLALTREAREPVAAHVAAMIGQIAAMVAEGVASGDFASVEPEATASALWTATARFHDPAHATSWADPACDAAFDGVWRLVMAGLVRRDA